MRIKEAFDLRTMKGTIFFMSDLHYNHTNVLKLSKRDDFCDIWAMNSYIENELKKVGPDDVVFDLGDMMWKVQTGDAMNLLQSIPSKNLYKVVGNHDAYNFYRGSQPALGKYFKIIADILDITVVDMDGTVIPIVLEHYPSLDWNGRYRGSLMIHGHCHGHVDDINESGTELRVDVGFDGKLAKSLDSFLVSIDDVLDYFYDKTKGVSFKDWADKNLHNNETEESN